MKTQSKKVIIGLCVIGSISSLYGITNSLIANIMASYSDIAPTTMSQLMTLPSIVGLVTSFAIGPLAMKFDKKKLLVAMAAAVFSAMMIFMIIGGRGPLWLLFVGAAVAGVASGANMTLISALINVFYDESKSGTYVAISTACIQGGAALANLASGFLAAGNGGTNWPHAYGLGLLIIPAVVLFWILVPGSAKSEETVSGGDASAESSGTAGTNGKEKIPLRVALIILMMVLSSMCLSAYAFNYSSYISEYQIGTAVQAGTIGTLNMVMGMLAGFTYAFWEKLFKKWLPLAGCAGTLIGVAAMAMAQPSMLGVGAAAVLAGIGHNLGTSSIMALIMKETPSRLVPLSVAISMGAVNISVYVSTFARNLVGGLLGGGLRNDIMAGMIFGVAAVVIAAFVIIKPAKTAE